MRKLARNGLAVVGTVVVIYYALVGLYKLRPLAEDEAPIRVRNGSFEFHAGKKNSKTWKWVRKNKDNADDTPNYSHEPQHFSLDSDRQLYLKVEPGIGGGMKCADDIVRFDGEKAVIEYQMGNKTLSAKIKRGNTNIFGLGYRTRIRKPEEFDLIDNDETLQYKGSSAQEGYIAEVRAGTGKCTFTKKEDLDQISICSSADASDCK